MAEPLLGYYARGADEDVSRLIELANNIPSGQTRSISLGNGYDSEAPKDLIKEAWRLANNLQGHVLGWIPQVRVKPYRTASGIPTQEVFLDIYKHRRKVA